MALITPIQSTGAHSTGSVANLAKAFTSNVTAGNVLVVMAGVWFTGDVSGTVSDSQGNTYAVKGTGKLQWWTTTAGSSGPCTVTVSVNTGTNFLSVGLAELPAGSYTYTGVTFRQESGTEPNTNNFVVTEDGAALFAMMTCQGDPAGTITEDAAWTLITENTDFSFLPYSWIWRNANAGTYVATWTVGASIDCYTLGLMVEGFPNAVIRGSAVFGVKTTVTATRAIAFGLDDATNVHDEAGKFKVFGNVEITGDLEVDGTIINTGSISTRSIGITIDGSGSTITTGVKGFIPVPFTGTITAVTILSTDPSVTSGSIVVDIWKDTYANYPPTDADSITASAPPTISTATKARDTTLTGWTVSVSAGDVLGFNVDSVTDLTRVTLVLTVEV